MAQPLARTEFAAALNQICSERGIKPEAVIETIKAAMVAAFRKDHADQFTEDTEAGYEYDAEIDPTTGAAKIFRVKGKKRKEVTPPGFGRIAAQTAKQVILQRVREVEKDAIIEEYTQKVGSMMSAMVLRFDGTNVIFDIGRGQGVMPPEEQIQSEYYKLNQRMMVLIKDIRDTMKGRTIIVSRSAQDLVKELFAREVPEVSSKAVKIKTIAREAGVRTKIAVHSSQEGVDPVGSCVGQKGIRVQAVINELGGEKIDIIQYSKKITDFIAAALSPAENLEIKVNEKKKTAEVTVPDDQLSLAIGRGGQNVRLAAKLTDYKIDIKGKSGKASLSVTGKEEYEIDQLSLPARTRKILVEAKITSLDLLKQKLDTKTKIDGIGPKAEKTIQKALASLPQVETPQPEEKPEAEPAKTKEPAPKKNAESAEPEPKPKKSTSDTPKSDSEEKKSKSKKPKSKKDNA